MLERCCVVAFDLARINELMLLVRDDVVMLRRAACAWCRYESGKDKDSYYDYEKVCIDYKNRRDFLHIAQPLLARGDVGRGRELPDPRARRASASSEYTGDEYQDAEYKVDRDAKEVGGADNRERAKFWEIWDKNDRARGLGRARAARTFSTRTTRTCELRTSSPAPSRPTRTVQRGSLVPVPDVLQYKDQLDELNTAHRRESTRCRDALEAKGFYPAGGARAGRGDRDRDQDQHARRACWCRSATGRRSAAARK